jgi:isopentenyl diphosphate isomerase/L-lactate dehydrogenase-like FMN-dependent dehydrogenase
MDIKEIRELARKRYEGTCRVCKVCDGRACAGEVPGMGGAGTGKTFKNNIEALAKIQLKLRTLHDAKNPDMSVNVFGKKLSAPIMIAPITGSSLNFGGFLDEKAYAEIIVEGAKDTELMAMTGDTAKPEFYEYGLEAMDEIGIGIPTIKPREVDAIIEKIKLAEKVKAPAIAIDVDGAGLITMALLGQPVGPKNESELKRIVNSTDLPVILKGIMTKEEARLAVNAGAKAIVVSNHGGRVLDSVAGIADVLEDIADEVKGEILIMADSGIRSGIDVYKYLALGADVVLVGRPIITGAVGGGVEGVKLILDTMKNELYKAMILTGCSEISDISFENIMRA